ncbi:MAG: hypothetical protein EHM67_09555 [Hyphomicrobiaceae bacterium]|nr:MAG: hypothetical protein EHM67_09555 [Hyphomicrobiaceae bacterium]
MSTPFWSVPREWPGETAFIVGGGPSVLGQDLEALRGRRVIAINSSVFTVPWADILFFGDWRWWYEPENRAAAASFPGRVVTTSRMVPSKQVLVCHKTRPPGLARESNSLMQRWTSLTAATNLAAHLIGPGGTIIWLGADGKRAADGRTHHHKPHPWPSLAGCYDRHYSDLVTIVPSLKVLGIAAFNASPGTAWVDLLPMINLQAALGERQAA